MSVLWRAIVSMAQGILGETMVDLVTDVLSGHCTVKNIKRHVKYTFCRHDSAHLSPHKALIPCQSICKMQHIKRGKEYVFFGIVS